MLNKGRKKEKNTYSERAGVETKTAIESHHKISNTHNG